ncbi:biopolymer transport protein ExbD [Roseibium hamelinense]|uniref:Biopolymer transport protein ExbD n=1 Tax=Roseibium hamelinense TaxID=150831 RepID=A0A562SNP8_9HYPH|nr:biopolymer transporter ExbD [Roseibium hamelinense]MTI44276.1 biopolymer transporter ExbD [Roseibium hamelinense]TWI82951.1 biopolymer transport protein ExbD [Roseibium hamelinense]
MILDEPPRRRPAIGLTSLIDVIFILIVFFMLVSSFDHYATVPLTVASGAQSAERIDKILALEILSSGDLVVAETNEPAEPALARAHKNALPVVVTIAPGVSTQDTLTHLDQIKATGITALTVRPGRRS